MLRLFCFAILFAVPQLRAALSVRLEPSVTSPQPLGTSITWTALPQGGGEVWYRFRARLYQQPWSALIDYSPANTFEWVPASREGWYEIQVSAQDRRTGEIAEAAVFYYIQPLSTGRRAVLTPTSHPLVYLYSAPSCRPGFRVRVNMQAPDGTVQHTSWRDCDEQETNNFYLAGLRAGTEYRVWHTEESMKRSLNSAEEVMATAETPDGLPVQALVTGNSGQRAGGILLQSSVFARTIATDLDGNIVWYYPKYISSLTRPDGDGRFFGVVQAPGDQSRQVLRLFDVVGTTLLETNAARVNDQLAALGKRPISGFHHEVRRLPDGHILALAGVEQILTDVQGPGAVNVMGDMIIVFDSDLRVVWTWDTFDYLDPSRKAVLGETCAAGGCTRTYLGADANDWTHGNSVELAPDGNLLYSSRHQDWLIKISYENGTGAGDVMWRMGKDGDFTFVSDDASPWFSHQHDANFQDQTHLMVFDNGNTRHAADPTANSRGQMLVIDEANRTVRLALNVDLGVFSVALGSAQALPGGNYHFDVGWTPGTNRSRAVEADANGNIVYTLESTALAYRSFRLTDLYARQ